MKKGGVDSERQPIVNPGNQLMPRFGFLAVIGMGCLFVPSTATADMIYSLVEYGDSNISVSGTITTNGTLGGLVASDVIDWDITVAGDNLPAPQTYTPVNSTFGTHVNFPSLSATEEQLVVGESPVLAAAFLDRPYGNGTARVVTWFSNPVTSSYWVALPVGTGAGQTRYLQDPGPVVVGTTASQVPEPSSLALIGMGGLSLFGYRWRRRKQAKLV